MSRYYRHNPDETIRHDWVSPLVLQPQPCPSHSNRACVDCGKWAASGGSRCEDCEEESEQE